MGAWVVRISLLPPPHLNTSIINLAVPNQLLAPPPLPSPVGARVYRSYLYSMSYH